MTREQVAEKLGEYYSNKYTKNGKPAKVRSFYDESKRAYAIQGSGLPAHPDLQDQYPHGWSLLDHVKPREARRLISDMFWKVPYYDIKDSYRLAMESAGVDAAIIQEVLDTVEDYATNEHGEE
jgi:hypothetical protein